MVKSTFLPSLGPLAGRSPRDGALGLVLATCSASPETHGWAGVQEAGCYLQHHHKKVSQP